MKNNKILGIVDACLGCLWIALSVNYYYSDKSNNIGTTYLVVGIVWITLGFLYIGRYRKEKKTIDYYNDNAVTFSVNTINADMSETRNKFLDYIPENGVILDWGCGSGRDAIAFKNEGYVVEATDASSELCKCVSDNSDIVVRNESFSDLNVKEKYDGIWACASLLHVEKGSLPGVLEKACTALKKDGYMYMSFKYGDFQGEREGRFFTDLTEESFSEILARVKGFKLIEQWISEDVRDDRDVRWLNIIVTRTE